MSRTRNEQDEPEACEVEDPETGQRYLMYRLPVGFWPPAPRLVYECPSCRDRFDPSAWTGACPRCVETGKRRKRRKKRC